MKCKDCDSCRKGYFKSRPDSFACIGVKEPFVICDINTKCTEYKEKQTKDYLPTCCYGLVNEQGKLIKYNNSPRLFVQKYFAQQAVDKWNAVYKDKVTVVTFEMKRKVD